MFHPITSQISKVGTLITRAGWKTGRNIGQGKPFCRNTYETWQSDQDCLDPEVSRSPSYSSHQATNVVMRSWNQLLARNLDRRLMQTRIRFDVTN